MTNHIERAILLGAVAGGLRRWAHEDPRTAPGLIKAADRHSAAARQALGEMLKQGGGRCAAPPPHARTVPEHGPTRARSVK